MVIASVGPLEPVPAVYIDESIHDRHGFIVTALVYARKPVEAAVADALQATGLTLGTDEFKCRSPMAADRQRQELRDRLSQVLYERTKIAWLISNCDARDELGEQVLATLETLRTVHDLRETPLVTFFDQGIKVRNPDRGAYECRPEQDSRSVLGLQLADLAAGIGGKVLAEHLADAPKNVLVGEGSGYAEGTAVSLEWELRMRVRYAQFTGSTPVPDPAFAYPRLMPLLGYGVFLAPNLDPAVRVVAEEIFRTVWLGCIH
jgi:hypothetical protein